MRKGDEGNGGEEGEDSEDDGVGFDGEHNEHWIASDGYLHNGGVRTGVRMVTEVVVKFMIRRRNSRNDEEN